MITMIDCLRCANTGKVGRIIEGGKQMVLDWSWNDNLIECPDCDGTGEVPHEDSVADYFMLINFGEDGLHDPITPEEYYRKRGLTS
ncbi:MAG: hypothetical protein ACXAEN_19260 [Candidatus Thorarchaeota archaeon]